MFTGLALAMLIGMLLGLLGGGGSILTVPVLVYALGYTPKAAIAMSLAVIGVTSLVGAAIHARLGNVRMSTAATFGLPAMVGALVGAKLAAFLTGGAQLVLLGVVLLAAAGSMLRSHPVTSDDVAPPAPMRRALLVPIALSVGILTGLVGVGGGFLVVPALVLLARVPMRQAVGTSLLVIAMNSAAGFVGYLGAVELDTVFLGSFTAAAIVGVLAGTVVIARIPQATLKRAFAVLLLIMGGFVLYKNRMVLQRDAALRPPLSPPRAAPAPATDGRMSNRRLSATFADTRTTGD